MIDGFRIIRIFNLRIQEKIFYAIFIYSIRYILIVTVVLKLSSYCRFNSFRKYTFNSIFCSNFFRQSSSSSLKILQDFILMRGASLSTLYTAKSGLWPSTFLENINSFKYQPSSLAPCSNLKYTMTTLLYVVCN